MRRQRWRESYTIKLWKLGSLLMLSRIITLWAFSYFEIIVLDDFISSVILLLVVHGNKLESLIRFPNSVFSAVRCLQWHGAEILAFASLFSLGLCIQMFRHCFCVILLQLDFPLLFAAAKAPILIINLGGLSWFTLSKFMLGTGQWWWWSHGSSQFCLLQ